MKYKIELEIAVTAMNERTAIDGGLDSYMDWEGQNEYDRAGFCVTFPNGRRCWIERDMFKAIFGFDGK